MKKTETKSVVLLQHHLKALRLPTILNECEKVAGQCATDNVDYLGFLLRLCELELIDRERRAADRRLKTAQIPNRDPSDENDAFRLAGYGSKKSENITRGHDTNSGDF